MSVEPLLDIRMSPYPRQLVLFDTIEAFSAFLDVHCGCSNPVACGHYPAPNVGGRCIFTERYDIFVVGIFDRERQAEYLVHELAHAVIACFDQIGLVINYASSEAFTYLQHHLFAACTAALATKEASPCSPSSPDTSAAPSPSSRSRSAPSPASRRGASAPRKTTSSRSPTSATRPIRRSRKPRSTPRS